MTTKGILGIDCFENYFKMFIRQRRLSIRLLCVRFICVTVCVLGDREIAVRIDRERMGGGEEKSDRRKEGECERERERERERGGLEKVVRESE